MSKQASVYFLSHYASGRLRTSLFPNEDALHHALATEWLESLKNAVDVEAIKIHKALQDVIQGAKLQYPEKVYASLKSFLGQDSFEWGTQRVELEPIFPVGAEAPVLSDEFTKSASVSTQAYFAGILFLLKKHGWTITRDHTAYAGYLPKGGALTATFRGYECEIAFSDTGKTIHARGNTVPAFFVSARTVLKLTNKVDQEIQPGVLPRAVKDAASTWLASRSLDTARLSAVALLATLAGVRNSALVPLKTAILAYQHEPASWTAQNLSNSLIGTGHFKEYASLPAKK